ncbi:probable elongation factor 1-delta isoform X1 [Ctenocephalides felis]|uniref:probable elongation factor 1-delta isoform X1 n=1 Tax=Ctenocephalides felis TaxID=7515 RepID=UPI000E6E235B|nr:probable elongation factor 1-delta isoform X1 [Ctenocephalides felis]
MACPLLMDKVWLDKYKYDDAEKQYYERLAKGSQCSLAGEVAKARQHIKNSLECMDGIAAMASAPNTEVLGRLTNIEKENIALRTEVSELRKLVDGLLSQVSSMRISEPFVAVCPAKPATPAAPAKDDDDDVDLFGSDSEEESEAIAKLKEERLAAYNAKKSKKPTLIAKSNIILDVKPWDDETDMKEMEKQVRAISTDGLLWGAAKLVPLAYGIHKLQISCVVEDDKVSIDWLQEELEKIEDYVQSVDIAAFNKV